MSRLIDADALFKAITEGKYTTGNILKDMELQQFINEQPTAYDVDAVIEQLEDWHNHYDDGIMVVSEAIDIVRKGGKE